MEKNLEKEIHWLENQVLKDQKETKKLKNRLIDDINHKGKNIIDNMPQFSEKYIEDNYGEPTKKLEGYIHTLLNVAAQLPFEFNEGKMNFSVSKNTYVKILKEVENIKSGVRLEDELIDIPETFDVTVGEIQFTFEPTNQ